MEATAVKHKPRYDLGDEGVLVLSGVDELVVATVEGSCACSMCSTKNLDCAAIVKLMKCSDSDSDSVLMSWEASNGIDVLSQDQDADFPKGILKILHGHHHVSSRLSTAT